MRRTTAERNRFRARSRGGAVTVVAIAGLALALGLAETIGSPLDVAGAAEPPLSPLCAEASPVAADAVEPLDPEQAENAAPAAALVPPPRGFDHRTLTPLRPALERAKRDRLALTGSRVDGALASGPAGGFALDRVACMTPLQTTPDETPATIVNGTVALYANSAPDTDTIVRPTLSGVSVVESRRGEAAPTSFSWRVGLPAGMRLRALPDGAVAIDDPADPAPAALATPHVVDASPASDPSSGAEEAKLTPSGSGELTLTSPPDAKAIAMTLAAKKGHRRHKPRAPRHAKAYPMVGISGNLSAEASNAACSFARSQPKGGSLMLLNFGQAGVQDGVFGAGRRPFHSNEEILAALDAAAHSYREAGCHKRGHRTTIAYGVGNYRLSRDGNDGGKMSKHLAGRVGTAQLHVARAVKHRKRDGAAVAGDLEPQWDPDQKGVGAAKALAHGASTGHLTYYDFGSAGHCPPYRGPARGCRRWGYKNLGEISQKHKAVALPQVYHSFQAKQWSRVRRAWDRRHTTRRHCQHHRTRSCFSFAGALSEPRACGAQLTPTRSWRHLWRHNRNGSVGRKLLLYNPHKVNC